MEQSLRHAVVSHAKTGVRDLPRNAAWALSKVIRPVATSSQSSPSVASRRGSPERAPRPTYVADRNGHASVEELLRAASEAAKEADAAQAAAVEQAALARAAAEDAQRAAHVADTRLSEARERAQQAADQRIQEAEADADEAVRRAQQQADERVEQVRAEATDGMQRQLEQLEADLRQRVDAAQTKAEDLGRRAQLGLETADGAAERARELADRARRAAEDAAKAASQTAERLGWEQASNPSDTVAIPFEQLESRTKAELLELAGLAHIEGRSAMTKAELIDALLSARTPA